MMSARKAVFPVVFSALIVSALVVRTIAARHGLPYIYNYDEPTTAGAALHMMTTGDFDPHIFSYGSLLIYLYYVTDVINFLHLMGQPETAPSYLTDLKDIHAGFVGSETEWLWTISHPSFYFWDRMVSVGLGIVTIVLTYRLAKHATGERWSALIAVAMLASLEIHIEHSAYTTPDGPIACFIVAAALFATLFQADGRRHHLLLSLVFCGLAMATKITGVLVIAVPAIALLARGLHDRREVTVPRLLLVPAVPLAVFLLAEPYSVINSVGFLGDVGFEIRHYKVLGHGANSSNPGVGQLLFQARQFYANLGMINAILVIVGLAGSLAVPGRRIVVLYPLIYMLYMAQMKVNFHRNFVQIYPFLAVFAAVGGRVIWQAANRSLSGPTGRAAAVAIPALFVLCFSVEVAASWITAAHAVEDKDSRSRLINEVNRQPSIARLVVPSDLRIHDQDLRRLRVASAVEPIAQIAACPATPAGTALVLPLALAEDAETEQQKADQALYAPLIAAAARDGQPLLRIEGSPLYLNSPTRSPGLVAVPLTAAFCDRVTENRARP